ncbi:Isopenicillin N synthase [Lasiodiplodia theobromae]|uniref:2OG-Fe oxygenase n=1 Tax=Lasiodiplodia theobromae TaxID=45133 RepID=UPI0015C3413C|nr:2OG-Fe oxygenase [Lasiodiplodia theobromae]KAF4540042.1 2OG-Fe oxygenase [Lasiodiplodia theobromae]KAF9632547.1 Isopenicillin N synthase [Lasiodiplodia theobromae]
MPSTVVQPNFHIPTVDIGPYLADPSSTEAKDVIEAVRRACTTSGFFQLIGHGIDATIREAMFAGSKALFDLPFEEKKALRRGKNRGYEVIGSQALQDGTLPDLKEVYDIVFTALSDTSDTEQGYYIGTDDVPFEEGKSYRPFTDPNIWPAEEQLSAAVFRDPVNRYYSEVEALSRTVMDIIAAALGHGPEVFAEMKKEPIAASIRLLHYPPQRTETSNEKQLGAGAHTDFGWTTLLLTDGHPGLEVLNQTTGEWVAVPPDRDAYVVNVGDMLQQITGGHFKSNVHRVRNLGDEDRYSVPYFFDGCLDARLARLDGKDQTKVLTVEEHMLERFATTYGRGQVKN